MGGRGSSLCSGGGTAKGAEDRGGLCGAARFAREGGTAEGAENRGGPYGAARFARGEAPQMYTDVRG